MNKRKEVITNRKRDQKMKIWKAVVKEMLRKIQIGMLLEKVKIHSLTVLTVIWNQSREKKKMLKSYQKYLYLKNNLTKEEKSS